MKKLGSGLLILLLIFQLTGCSAGKSATIEKPSGSNAAEVKKASQAAAELGRHQKADFIEAVSEIQDKYVYLEEKFGVSREAFMKSELEYAETVNWGADKDVFIKELRKLRSTIHDGHAGWALSDSYKTFSGICYLGFTPTMTSDGRVVVGKVYAGIAEKGISEGDELILWNGAPVKKAVQELGEVIPQSTEWGTMEKACRYLTFEMGSMPLRDHLASVRGTFRKADGTEYEKVLEWKDCGGTTDPEEYYQDKTNSMVLITKGMLPSLEALPEDAQYPNPRLAVYFLTINGKTYGVIHPRSFSDWTVEDMNKAMTIIREKKPVALVVDLKDSAGGYFDQVIYLARALNVKESLRLSQTVWDKDANKRVTTQEYFKDIESTIKNPVSWGGKVYFRTNAITVSGGDYFIRWMKRSHRGEIFGGTTAGAGAGTDTIALRNTGAEWSVPSRDRAFPGDTTPIEGHGTEPDTVFFGEISEFLTEISQ